MEGIGFKITMAVFAIAIILGLFLMVDYKLLQNPPEEGGPSQSQKIMDCYQAAVNCKEKDNLCGECYNACQYFSTGEEVKKGALQNCLSGNPQKIIGEESENTTSSNSTSSNATSGNSSNSTTPSQPEEPIQK